MPHVMIPASPFRRASLPDPNPPQPPVPDPAPEPQPAPIPGPDPVGDDEAPGDELGGERPTLVLAADSGGAGGDGDDDAEDGQSDPGGDSDPHPPLPEPGAA